MAMPWSAGIGPLGGAIASDESPEVLLDVDKVGNGFEHRDSGTHARLARIELPAQPHELVVTPDKETASVSIDRDGISENNTHPGHQVALIDLAARKLVNFIDVRPFFAPSGMTLDTSGGLWLTCERGTQVLIVEPRAKTVLTTIPTVLPSTHWIVRQPDGEKFFG